MAGSEDKSQSLVAFVTLRPGQAVTADELRSYVAERLPRQFVPNRVAIVDSLPTLPNGKLDRVALRTEEFDVTGQAGPLADSVSAAASGDAPSETERQLIGIWAEVLSMEYVEPEDDFFELGGHSLLATRLIARVNQEIGCKASVADLFDHPKLSAFARLIEEAL